MKNNIIETNVTSSSPFRGGREGLLVKICGMKYSENIRAVATLHPDFMGFIFYPKSPRYAEPLDLKTLEEIPLTIKKIGVFVNEDLENILTIVLSINSMECNFMVQNWWKCVPNFGTQD